MGELYVGTYLVGPASPGSSTPADERDAADGVRQSRVITNSR
jgi:hypothetical protein